MLQIYKFDRKGSREVQKTMTAKIRTIIAGFFILAAGPLDATGFGWYAILFDYEKFESDFDADLDQILTLNHADLYGERLKGSRPTDGAVFSYIEANEEDFGVEYPQTFELELMWHSALMTIVRQVKRIYPDTPLQHLATGRRFLGPDKMPGCEQYFELVHGSCRTYIMFTFEETKTAFWQLTEFVETKPSFRDPQYLIELIQLRDIFKEGALKNKAVYFYGHD